MSAPKTFSILVAMDGEVAMALRQRMIEEKQVEGVLSMFVLFALRSANVPPWRPAESPLPIEWPEAWSRTPDEVQPFVLDECHYGIDMTLGEDNLYVPTRIRVLPIEREAP